MLENKWDEIHHFTKQHNHHYKEEWGEIGRRDAKMRASIT